MSAEKLYSRVMGVLILVAILVNILTQEDIRGWVVSLLIWMLWMLAISKLPSEPVIKKGKV